MGNSIRVLLIDDGVAAAELAATYLERASDRIEAVFETVPSNALERVTDDEQIDCVVSDHDMPEMTGLELLDAVRDADPDLPFVLFTGKGSEEIASEAISAGVTDYLQKETGTDQYTVLANRIENAVSQHRAEREAAEANEQVRRIFERITDAFFALDEDREITYANRQAAVYTDHSKDELIGRHIRTILPESEAEPFYDAFERAFETQSPVTIETESVVRSGMWLEVRVYPSEDGLSVYFRDVSERKRAQMELQETKAKIEALHDVATQAVTCTTRQDVYDLAVEAAEEILAFDLCVVDGISDGELVPRAVSRGLPTDGYYDTTPIDTENNLAALVYRTGETSLVRDVRETDVVPAESEYRSVLSVPFGEFGVFQAVSNEPDAFDEDDRELSELLATHLTEALARVDFEEELRAERDRFAALFENLPNAVVRYDLAGTDPIGESVNPAFEEVFGWDADTILGESVDEHIVPDDRRDEGESLNRQVTRDERIEGVEVHRVTRDGGRDFLLHTAPVQDGDSEAFAIYVDITEQKERERQLARQNERLEEFASVVSHDLRNPLNVAQGRFEMLADEVESPHLAPLGRSLTRMDSLVADLLALARRGQVVDQPDAVDLSEAAEAAWSTVDTGSAKLTHDGNNLVEADEARFRELLENLFRNAVEHGSTSSRTSSGDAVEHGSASSQPSSDHADLTVEVGPLDDGNGFYVADDGSGIPEDERDRVCDYGYTTEEDGTGFGLAIVTSIADAHGWEVEVCESDTCGACFEFSEVTTRDRSAERENRS